LTDALTEMTITMQKRMSTNEYNVINVHTMPIYI